MAKHSVRRPDGSAATERVERAGSNGTACSGARSGKGRTNRIARFIFYRKNIVINAEKHNPAVRRRSPRRRSSRSLSQAAPPFCQSERTVSRAPMHQIMWLRGFRAHTISRRGFNLFKPLRRHFPATRFCRQPLSQRPKRLGSKGRRSARRPPPGRRSAAKVDVEVSDCVS